MPSIALYLIGFIILIAGLAMGASLLGVPESWIIVGIIVLVGLMILSLASRFNHRG
jgi:uncharacterized membrane protein